MSDSLAVGASLVIARALALVAAIVLARQLGEREYGAYVLVYTTFITVQSVASAGLGITATRHIAAARLSNPNFAAKVAAMSYYAALAAGVTVTIAAMVCASVIAQQMFGEPSLKESIRLGALSVAFLSLNTAQNGILSGIESYRALAISNCWQGMSLSAGAMIGAHAAGVEGASAGLSIAAIVSCLGTGLLVRRSCAAREFWFGLGQAVDRRTTSLLFTDSVPSVLGSMSIAPAHWWALSILSRSSGLGEVALFNAANNWFSLVMLFPSILTQVTLAKASRLAHEGKGLGSFLLRASIAQGAFCVPVVLFIIICAPLIMSIYGQAFAAGTPTLRVCAVTAILAATIAPFGQYLTASGMMWTGALLNCVWCGAFVSLVWLLRPYGALGFSYARLLAYVLHLVLCVVAAILTTRRRRIRGSELVR